MPLSQLSAGDIKEANNNTNHSNNNNNNNGNNNSGSNGVGLGLGVGRPATPLAPPPLPPPPPSMAGADVKTPATPSTNMDDKDGNDSEGRCLVFFSFLLLKSSFQKRALLGNGI